VLTRWSAEQVLALAPDASSVAAGRKLSAGSTWSGLGACAQPAVVWGLCRGSGKTPYRAAVDMAGPAFSCSCPSRKFPCKHALGLLLLWAAGGVPDAGEPVDWAQSWLDSRAERVARAQARVQARVEKIATKDAGGGPADPVAALRRAERRRDRMAGGLAELEQWLRDQVRTGLAAAPRGGYTAFDAVAARMVDAQVPGVAAVLRRLGSVVASGEGWPGRLLEEYALLHLLAAAGRSVTAAGGDADGLPATLLTHLGVGVAKEEVLARPAVRDRWAVLGLRDEVEERLSVRRVWLRGERSARMALVMSFAVAGQSLDATLLPGSAVPADLHFYPGRVQLRALVGAGHGPVGRPGQVTGAGLESALQAWSQALARDPWTPGWPVVVADALPVSHGGRWWLTCGDEALPLVGQGESVWTLVAVCGGRATSVLAEVVPGGVRVISVLAPGPSGDETVVVPL
jgi:hypothetical protein